MPAVELNEARAAETAIGRRPLTGREKQALFAVWRSIHGGAHDCEQHLASLEREAAQKREQERASTARLHAEREAERAKGALQNRAVRATAAEVAKAIRANLEDILKARFAGFRERPDLVTIVGPGEAEVEPTKDAPIVVIVRPLNFERQWPLESPVAAVEVEIRALDASTTDAILNASARRGNSPVGAALDDVQGGTLSTQKRGRLTDTRHYGSSCDAFGNYSCVRKGGFVSRADRLTLVLNVDPTPTPKPAAAPQPVHASWRGEGARDWTHSG